MACGGLRDGLHDFPSFVGTNTAQDEDAQVPIGRYTPVLLGGQFLVLRNVEVRDKTNGRLGEIAL